MVRMSLRFLSLMMLTIGVGVALLLWQAARGLHAPPGAAWDDPSSRRLAKTAIPHRCRK
jgi:hypothetical protein